MAVPTHAGCPSQSGCSRRLCALRDVELVLLSPVRRRKLAEQARYGRPGTAERRHESHRRKCLGNFCRWRL
jgi:hypothetical protein